MLFVNLSTRIPNEKQISYMKVVKNACTTVTTAPVLTMSFLPSKSEKKKKKRWEINWFNFKPLQMNFKPHSSQNTIKLFKSPWKGC